MRTSVPQTLPPGSGWRPWLAMYVDSEFSLPYDYVEVEIWRKGWMDTYTQKPDANPEMNANGLWWRPAGPKLTPEAKLAWALGCLFSAGTPPNSLRRQKR